MDILNLATGKFSIFVLFARKLRAKFVVYPQWVLLIKQILPRLPENEAPPFPIQLSLLITKPVTLWIFTII